jgi:hypothetical protein
VQTVDGATGGDIYGDLHLHSWLTVGDMVGNPGLIEITNGANTSVRISGDEGGAGSFWVSGTDGAASVVLDGMGGLVYITKSGSGGNMYLYGGGITGSYIDMQDPNNNNTLKIMSSEDGGDGAAITLYQASLEEGVAIDAEDEAGENGGGSIYLSNSNGVKTIGIDGDTHDDASFITVKDAIGNNKIWLDPDASGSLGAEIVMLESGIQTIQIRATETGADGSQIFLFEADGDTTIDIDAEEGATGGGIIRMYDDNNTKTIHMDAHGVNYGGAQVSLSDYDGTTTISLDAASGGFDGGANVKLLTGTGTETIRLDADYGGTGEGRVITSVLEITGGADLSEQFEIRTGFADVAIIPGMVVCIDPAHPGELVVSSCAYDPTVAGIISGAGGIRSGMIMGQAGSMTDGKYPVALTGRVYCRVDASHSPIQPGDLLTTSGTPGHAMKVNDFARSQGAIIGKAMTSLQDGKGLVLVLVSLQ